MLDQVQPWEFENGLLPFKIIKVVCVRINFFNNFNFFESQETVSVLRLDFSEI